MSNIISVQKLQDGPRNTVYKLIAQLDTSDESYTVKIDPALLSSVDSQGDRKANRVRIEQITAIIEDGLAVNLWWDETGAEATATLIETLVGRIDKDYRPLGGLVNNETTPTGKIALSTQGWTTGLTLSYNIIIQTAKYVV